MNRPELDDWHERSGRLLDEIDAAADRAIADMTGAGTGTIVGGVAFLPSDRTQVGTFGHITAEESQALAETDSECPNT